MLVQVDELKVFVATGGKDFDPDLPTILFFTRKRRGSQNMGNAN